MSQEIAESTKQSLKDRLLKGRLKDLIARYEEKPWWRLETALVIAAVIFGFISGALSHANSKAMEDKYQALFTTRPVLVASKDLQQGEFIDPTKFATVPMLVGNITSNHLSENQRNLIIGKQIAIDLKKGDPLFVTAVQGAAEVDRLADKVPPGKRLFTLSIDDRAAANGFIKPNDHVDILAHIRLPDRGLTTFTVLQDVTLVSVGRNSILDSEGASTGTDISFFVESQHSEMLAFAQKRGSFSLSLRNPKDIGKSKTSRGIDISEFLDYDGIYQVSGGSELKVLEKGKEIKKKAEK